LILAEGCKVFTKEGFTPIEQLEGKTVEINCLPYTDIATPLKYCNGHLQEAISQTCNIYKSGKSSSTGFISFPLYRTTNFLCCNLNMYSRMKNTQAFSFLNTIDSIHTTAPLLVRNMTLHPDFIKYKVYDDQYETAVNGVSEYLYYFTELYNGNITMSIDNGFKFILQTELNSRFLNDKISRNTLLPLWKYSDNIYLREYFIKAVPEMKDALIALSHISGFIFSVEDDLFKLYFTRFDTDKIEGFMPSQLKNINSITKKRKFLQYDLNKFFKREENKAARKYTEKLVHKSIDFHKNISRVVSSRLENYYEDMREVALRVIPLPDRSSIYWNAPYINLPLEYFSEVEWFELHSATPRLVYVESPSGLLFIVSTLGGF